jgi:hypothetical protein
MSIRWRPVRRYPEITETPWSTSSLQESPMRYLILIYENEKSAQERLEKAGEKAGQEEMQKWFEYTERLKASGCYLGGEALQPTATATTVRTKGGKTMTTDGPFAETKEQLGGFYMVNCKDLDEAIKWASQIPSAGRGPVEVRPIMEFGEQ